MNVVLLLALSALAGVGLAFRRELVVAYNDLVRVGGRRGLRVTGDPRTLGLVVGAGALAFGAYGIGLGIGIGGAKRARPGTPTTGTTYSAPSTPTKPTIAIIDSSTVRWASSSFSGTADATHDSTNAKCDAYADNMASPFIDSTTAALITDTVASNAGFAVGTVYACKVRYKANPDKGDWSNYSDTAAFTMTATTWPNNEPNGMSQQFWGTGTDKFMGKDTVGMTYSAPILSGGGWEFGGAWHGRTLSNVDSVVKSNVTSTGSRYGTSVLKRFYIGDDSNWHGYAGYSFAAIDTVYVRSIIKYSSNYDRHSSGEKFYYLGCAFSGCDGADMYVVVSGAGKVGIANEMPGASYASSAVANHLSSFDLDTVFGRYVTYEGRFIFAAQGANAANRATLWVDGTQVLDSAGLTWVTTAATVGFSKIEFYDFWGGGGDTKTANDSVLISELKVSGH